jgi:hypothetical protein
VRQDQVTARRQGGDQPADDAVRVFLVGDEVQDRDHHQPDRTAEVQGLRRFPQDVLRRADVGLDVVGRAGARRGGEQRAGVNHDQRVVVDVDHPGLRRYALGDFVGVVGGRQARADVQELPDAPLAGEQRNRGSPVTS